MNDSGKQNAKGATTRRQILRIAGLTAVAGVADMVSSGMRQTAWAAGSDAPEKAALKVGFIPLTDCASLVAAAEKGFDRKYGLRLELSKEASWAAVRDKLVNGELDAAHVLYGLIYGVQLGIGGQQKDMSVLMTLNRNGQGITMSNALKDQGITTPAQLKARVAKGGTPLTFAQTFPTGTHAMWLNYWLAAAGINPLNDVKTIVVPPPQMVANMRIGNMDGFCVGEPWNGRAVQDGIGFTAVTTQDIWPDHPEKALGTTAEFVKTYPNAARALVSAVLDASRYVDTLSNRSEIAKLIAQKSYVNTAVEVIEGRMLGQYDNGLGRKWQDPRYMKFFDDGAVNFPYLSDGMWFLTQHKRWGLLKTHPDYAAVAKQVNRIDLYTQAAEAAKVAVPKSPLRKSVLLDGVTWDGSKPAAYADAFAIKA
ncbi:MAG: hypothetical protein RLZZ200_2948 [Pseudomonadota bacterium]|jgi:nitrate/nitrite transport system substrate-binding protein